MGDMNYEEYKKAHIVDPSPTPRYRFSDSFSVALFFEDYEAAVAYYTEVLGPPGYVEGEWTRGWNIHKGWLTLLKGKEGGPKNVEVIFEVATTEEAEKMQAAFIAAGGRGDAPSDQLMYRPIRYCPVTDPFGTEILVISALE